MPRKSPQKKSNKSIEEAVAEAKAARKAREVAAGASMESAGRKRPKQTPAASSASAQAGQGADGSFHSPGSSSQAAAAASPATPHSAPTAGAGRRRKRGEASPPNSQQAPARARTSAARDKAKAGLSRLAQRKPAADAAAATAGPALSGTAALIHSLVAPLQSLDTVLAGRAGLSVSGPWGAALAGCHAACQVQLSRPGVVPQSAGVVEMFAELVVLLVDIQAFLGPALDTQAQQCSFPVLNAHGTNLGSITIFGEAVTFEVGPTRAQLLTSVRLEVAPHAS